MYSKNSICDSGPSSVATSAGTPSCGKTLLELALHLRRKIVTYVAKTIRRSIFDKREKNSACKTPETKVQV